MQNDFVCAVLATFSSKQEKLHIAGTDTEAMVS